jgi:hypothetical protein
MEKKFEIKCLHINHMIAAGIIVRTEDDGTVSLLYNDEENVILIFNDAHLFTSFCRLRRKLLTEDKILLCKGARIDVHPTGSQLKWIYAYQLQIGERITQSANKVVLFDDELDVNRIVTVEEQEEFYIKWLNSIDR